VTLYSATWLFILSGVRFHLIMLLFKWDVTLMVSEQFVLRMTRGCGFVMPRGRKLSIIVEFVSETKSFKIENVLIK